MSKITAIASGLGATQAPSQIPEALPVMSEQSPPEALRSVFPTEDPRLTLINSLKPLLREDKRDRIDALTRALTLSTMMKNLKK